MGYAYKEILDDAPLWTVQIRTGLQRLKRLLLSFQLKVLDFVAVEFLFVDARLLSFISTRCSKRGAFGSCEGTCALFVNVVGPLRDIQIYANIRNVEIVFEPLGIRFGFRIERQCSKTTHLFQSSQIHCGLSAFSIYATTEDKNCHALGRSLLHSSVYTLL